MYACTGRSGFFLRGFCHVYDMNVGVHSAGCELDVTDAETNGWAWRAGLAHRHQAAFISTPINDVSVGTAQPHSTLKSLTERAFFAPTFVFSCAHHGIAKSVLPFIGRFPRPKSPSHRSLNYSKATR